MKICISFSLIRLRFHINTYIPKHQSVDIFHQEILQDSSEKKIQSQDGLS